MPRDLARELDDTPDVPIRVWKPAVNEKLIGHVFARDQVLDKFNDGATVERLLIDTDDGERVAVFANKVVLLREITEKNPQVGDRIAMRRLPDVPGKPYQRFLVLVDHAAADDTGSDDLKDAF